MKAKSKINNLEFSNICNHKIAFPYVIERPNPIVIDTIVLRSYQSPTPRTEYGETSVSATACIRWINFIEIAPHYFIDQSGVLYYLVDLNKMSKYSTKSKMPDGRVDVSRFSIEVGLAANYNGDYTRVQLDRLLEVVAFIKKRFQITDIVLHKDISQQKEALKVAEQAPLAALDFVEKNKIPQDPWCFPWERFHQELAFYESN